MLYNLIKFAVPINVSQDFEIGQNVRNCFYICKIYV